MTKKKKVDVISIAEAQAIIEEKPLAQRSDDELTPEQLKRRIQNRHDALRKKQLATERKLKAAMGELPQTAPAARELAWIRSHPAMSRHARTDDAVVITADDVRDAPSRSAANQLQHWANRPNDFFKQLMQVERNQIGEVDPDTLLEDDDDIPPEVTRIDEMLQLIRGAKKVSE